jgi:hypothetical protein
MVVNKYGLDEVFVSCDCGAEVLRVVYEPILDSEDGHLIGGDHMKDLDLAIFSLPSATWTWWNRLRCIWQIIRNGKPFNDQIMLDYDQTKNLVSTLNKFLEFKPSEEAI